MRVESLSIRNFLSFGDEAQTLSLPTLGLVLVEGENRDEPLASSNGSGKSSLIEALVWGLTGKTIRGLRGSDVAREGAIGDCEVRLTGTHNAQTWEVRRGREAATKRPFLHFYVDGKVQTLQGDPTGTQARIESFFSITHDLLVNTLVFGQGDKWRFSELTDARRKELFDQLLGTSRFTEAQAWVKEQVKDLLAQHVEVDAQYREAVQLRNAKRETLSTLRAVLKKQQERDIKDTKERIEEVNEERARLEKTAEEEESLHKRKLLAENEHAGARGELRATEDLISQNKAALQVAKKQLGEEWTQIVTLERKLASAFAPGDACSKCGSIITKDTYEKHSRALERDLVRMKRSHEATQKVVDDAKVNIRRRTARVKSLQKVDAAKSKALSDITQEIVYARQAVYQISRCDAQIKDLKKRLAAVKKRSASKEVETCRDEIRRAKSDAYNHKRKRDALAVELEHHKFWLQGFGRQGVSSLYLDHIVPVMNKRANEYAHYLMRGTTIEFDTQTELKSKKLKDKFDVVVNHHHGSSKYAGSSGGEKRKVDIVVARTLQSLGESSKLQSNMAWFDEVFESLDEKSCEAVLSFLRAEAKRVDSLFVISHLEWMKPHFSRVLRVVKEHGESRLEWSN